MIFSNILSYNNMLEVFYRKQNTISSEQNLLCQKVAGVLFNY